MIIYTKADAPEVEVNTFQREMKIRFVWPYQAMALEPVGVSLNATLPLLSSDFCL